MLPLNTPRRRLSSARLGVHPPPRRRLTIRSPLGVLGNVKYLNERVIEFDDMLQEYKTDKGNTFNAGR